MRWKFYNPKHTGDVAYRKRVLALIDSWWEAFQHKTDDLDAIFTGKSEWDLVSWMNRRLNAIDSRLMWEFGPAVSGKGHRLVITPESCRQLRPLVDTIIERAPTLDGWEFYSYRQPEHVDVAMQLVATRSGIDVSNMHVCLAKGEDHLIDLDVLLSDCASSDDEEAMHAAFLAVEALLGEECLDKWIGQITVSPLEADAKPSKAVSLALLRPNIESMIEHTLATCARLPLHKHRHRYAECALTADSAGAGVLEEGPPWSVFDLKHVLDEPPRPDYPDKADLFIGTSCYEKLWLAMYHSPNFQSCRFSPHDETFCYLKIDLKDGLDPSRFQDRGDIEEHLDKVLASAEAGITIGGGSGRRYAYIDLALADVDKGIEVVRNVLTGGGIGRRCWLQFCDLELLHEWVGMYDDAPSPPVPETE